MNSNLFSRFYWFSLARHRSFVCSLFAHCSSFPSFISGSVHFLFPIQMCGIVSLLRFVISTVIQFSDVHSSHICLAVLFPHNCYPIYSLTL